MFTYCGVSIEECLVATKQAREAWEALKLEHGPVEKKRDTIGFSPISLFLLNKGDFGCHLGQMIDLVSLLRPELKGELEYVKEQRFDPPYCPPRKLSEYPYFPRNTAVVFTARENSHNYDLDRVYVLFRPMPGEPDLASITNQKGQAGFGNYWDTDPRNTRIATTDEIINFYRDLLDNVIASDQTPIDEIPF